MKTETITCESCQASFEWEHDLDEKWRELLKPNYCEPCLAIAKEQEELAKREAKQRKLKERIDGYVEGIRGKIPPLFQKTDINHPRFNRAGWDKLKDWRPTDEKPWLGLIGETGTSKSRIGHLLSLEIAREMANDRFSAMTFSNNKREPGIMLVSSNEITSASMLQFSNKQHATRPLWDDRTPAQQARDFLDALRTADFLLIDDIGKGRLSPAVAAEFFAIVDHRYQYQLPMIWTANSTPEEIASCMSEDMAAPFAGRLNDSSRIVRFKA